MSAMELTAAEKLLDATINAQRQKGRKHYGQGLDHRDTKYDWLQMALEESVDLTQYLTAEVLKLREQVERLSADRPDFTAYQEAAMITAPPEEPLPQALAIRALGLAGEAGEVVEHIKKHLGHGHMLDKDKVGKELGDVLWYIATLADACGLRLGDIAANNIEKLKARYPEGFSHKASRERAL